MQEAIKPCFLDYFVNIWQLIKDPFDVIVENPQFRHARPLVRVEKIFEEIQLKLPGQPDFLLCLLPERRKSDLYGCALHLTCQ